MIDILTICDVYYYHNIDWRCPITTNNYKLIVVFGILWLLIYSYLFLTIALLKDNINIYYSQFFSMKTLFAIIAYIIDCLMFFTIERISMKRNV